MDILFKDYGDSIRKTTNSLPPRDDIICFSEAEQAEYDKNIKWYDCPPEHQASIEEIIKEYWDIFVERGLRQPIRGFEFRIETDLSNLFVYPNPVMDRMKPGLSINKLLL
jgi:hypothetical protein